ncbi:MAG TPA: hypothetical protein VKQ29_05700 [Aliidongia sp.]|nr:hypothetical protein [Aliidongia sp.]
MTALLMIGSIVLLVAVLGAVAWGARRWQLHPEVARKTIHVGLGLYCLTLPALFDRTGPVLGICGMAVILLLAARAAKQRHAGLGAGLHGVARESYGELLFAISVALLFVFGHRNLVTYLVPLAILTLSDAAAALVGIRYGHARFRVEEGVKSLEGAAIFLLTAWIITMSLLLDFSEAPRLNVIVLGGLIALYGTLVEAQSWRGWDNFFVPMAIHMVLSNNLEAPPSLLLEGAGIGIAGLAAMLLLRRRLGLDAHAAGFMATVLATIGMASSTWNVVVPALALGCHLLARDPDDGLRPYPHLRLALVMVLLAFAWYLFGVLTPYPTVYAFNVSFAALGLALLGSRGRIWLALAMVPVFWVAVAARWLLQAPAPPFDAANMEMRLCILLLAAAVPSAARRLSWRIAGEGLGLLALAAGGATLRSLLW